MDGAAGRMRSGEPSRAAPRERAPRSESIPRSSLRAAAPGEQGAVALAKEHDRCPCIAARDAGGSVALVASAVPASARVRRVAARRRDGARGRSALDAALVVSEGGGAALAGDDLGEQLLCTTRPRVADACWLRSGAEHGRLAHVDGAWAVAYAPVPAPGTPAARGRARVGTPSESPSAPMSAPTSAPALNPSRPRTSIPWRRRAAVRAGLPRRASGGAPAEAGSDFAAGRLRRRRRRSLRREQPRHRGRPAKALVRSFGSRACRGDAPTTRRDDTISSSSFWRRPGCEHTPQERETVLEHELVAALLCVRSLHNEAAEAAEAGEEAAVAAGGPRGAARGATPQAADAAVRGRPAVEVLQRALPPRTRRSPRWRRVPDRPRGGGREGWVHERAAGWRRSRVIGAPAPRRIQTARVALSTRGGARRRRHPDGTRG